MYDNFKVYLTNLLSDRRDTHFKYSVDADGRIYYGGNSHTFKKNRRKELKRSNKNRLPLVAF